MARPDGVKLFINDMAAFARKDWLGSEPKLKKQLEDVMRIGREVVSYEDMLNTNTRLMNDRYPQGLPPFRDIKAMDRPLAKKLCEASMRLADSTIRYQQAMNELVNVATPEIMARFATAYGLPSADSIRDLQQRFAQSEHLVDNIADVMAHRTDDTPIDVAKLPPGLREDVDKFYQSIPNEAAWFAYYRDPEAPGRLAATLSKPEAAVPIIMLRALSGINVAISGLTDRNRKGRDQLRAHWPEGFEGLKIG